MEETVSCRDEHDALAGTPYRTVGPIARSMMAEVVEGEHRALRHRVVVKLLREEHFARFELKSRLRLEAKALQEIRHESLVRVLDDGETLDGRTFLVMERLHGRTFREELCARGHIPVAEAAAWMREVLSGLGAAHAAGVVHRDVKPENLFLSESGSGARRVKVLDFGLAKVFDAGRNIARRLPRDVSTTDGVQVGTPRYFSPEQARAERDIDPRADIYAVGCVLFELIAGRGPFDEWTSAEDVAWAHVEEEPPTLPSVAPQQVPPEMAAIVKKALAKKREDRFQDAEQFQERLARWTNRGG